MPKIVNFRNGTEIYLQRPLCRPHIPWLSALMLTICNPNVLQISTIYVNNELRWYILDLFVTCDRTFYNKCLHYYRIVMFNMIISFNIKILLQSMKNSKFSVHSFLSHYFNTKILRYCYLVIFITRLKARNQFIAQLPSQRVIWAL